MAVGMLVEAPGVNAEGYDSIMQHLEWETKPKPQGFVSHYAGPTESGWLVFEIPRNASIARIEWSEFSIGSSVRGEWTVRASG